MPREYQIKPGTPSPSPMQFGSADINLQTPRFVAQTNVAASENPFEALNKILGGISTVVKQSIDTESDKIRGQISYSNALRQEEDRKRADAERVRIEQERESTKKAFELKTKLEQQAIKANTPEEVAKVAEEIRQRTETDPKLESALTEAYRSARTQESYLRAKEDKAALDSNKAIQATILSQAASAVQDSNLDALNSLYRDAVEKSRSSTDPDKKLMYAGIAKEISYAISKTESEQETAANKEELKLRTAAVKLTDQAVDRVKPRFFGDDMIKFMSQFDSFSGTALSDQVFLKLSQEVETQNESVQELLKGATDVEIEAFNDVLKKSTDGIVTKIMEYRQQRHERESFESYVEMASLFANVDLNETVVNINGDSSLTPGQRDHALKRVAYNFIDNQASAIDKLNAARDVANADPAMMAPANHRTTQIIKDIQGEVESVHDGLFIPNLPPEMVDSVASGWLLQFATKNDLIDWVLTEKFGTTREIYDTDVDIQRIVSPVVTKVATEWDREEAKFESRKSAELKAAERASKKKDLTPSEAFSASTLSMYMDEKLPGIKYGTLNAEQLVPMVIDAMTGYATDGVPTQLMEAVKKNIGDERNYPLIQAFWKVMETANDDTISLSVNSQPEMFESFALGQFLNYMATKDVTQYTVNTQAKDFIANIQAYRAPGANTERFKEEQRIRNETMASLAIGQGLDTSSILDYSGIEPNQIIKSMSLADQERFQQLSGVAAAFNEKPAEFLSHMLKANGFRIYSYNTEADKTTFKLLNPYQVRPGIQTRGLPDPNELEQNSWSYYLASKKDDIAKALNNRQKRLGAVQYTYTASDIETVEIAPTASDLEYGRCALKAKIAGEWKLLDSVSDVHVTAQEYTGFKAESKISGQLPYDPKKTNWLGAIPTMGR